MSDETRPPGDWEWFAGRLEPTEPDPSLPNPRSHPVVHVAVRDGGMLLRVIYTHGSTHALQRVDVREDPSAVHMRLWVGQLPAIATEGGFALATSELRVGCVDVRLRDPLGDRPVISGGSPDDPPRTMR